MFLFLFLPGKDGLLHISEIDWKRLETIEEAGLKEGDEIEVKLLDIDPKTGKFKLSHKVLLPRPEGGIAPGTAFEDIPDDWVCPLCGVGKDDFEVQED